MAFAGGARLIQDQAACPFRAFAAHRLGATRLEEPHEGLDARERGSVLHAAVACLWGALRSSERLAALREEELAREVEQAVELGLARWRTRRESAFKERFLALERERLQRLLHEWLALERQRAPFEVLAVEEARSLEIGGVRLELRLDRADRLDAGGDPLLDYKTGKAQTGSWFDPRPNKPQLPLYALATETPPVALTFARLARGDCAFEGLAEREASRQASGRLRPPRAAPVNGADNWRPGARPSMRWASSSARVWRRSIPSTIRRPAISAICTPCAGSRSCSIARPILTRWRTRTAEVPPRRPPPNEQQLSLLLDEPAQALPQPPRALPVADARQRADALDPRRSFIVQAPAGSGKTGLLIQRFLVLLARVAKPEEVVAITFTRKAAAEMRSRVLAALRAAREGLAPDSDHEAHTLELAAAVLERDASLRWGLETDPNRLQVQTIDSLCVGLAERLPLLSGLGPAPQIREDAWDLYREAARETLGLLEEAAYTEQVAPLLQHVDNDVAAAEALLAGLLGKRDQWRRHLRGGAQRAELERALANLSRERMQQAREAMPEVFAGAILATVRYAAANLAAVNPRSPLVLCADLETLPGVEIEDLALWRGIADLFLTNRGALRKKLDKRGGFLSASEGSPAERKQRKQAKEHAEALLENLVAHQDFVAALHEIRELPPTTYDERQWAFIEALSGLLRIAVAQLDLTFRHHGAVDFVALTLAAIQALGEPDAPTDLALALDYRIQHLLIDEFQDTSQSQFELLLRLTAGWQSGDGRTVFVVGDPMQSIYRFREAEVGLFLRAWHAGLGGVALEPLALSVNFRAQAGLVEWVNDVFARVLPAREDLASGAVPFSASIAQEAASPGVAVQIHAFVPPDRVCEAQRVLEIIAHAQRQEPQGSVALLVRGRSHLVEIVPRLKDAGLRFRAIEIEELSGRAAVRDLYALTRALLHPADRTAWLSVLRAPWCGLTLRDLEMLVGDDRVGVLWVRLSDVEVRSSLSADGARRLDQLVAALEPVLDARGRGPLRTRVEAAWLRLGGPACAEDDDRRGRRGGVPRPAGGVGGRRRSRRLRRAR